MDCFNSRRSCVFSTKGCTASSQPIASQVGVRILNQGGNAIDAAVAMAAAINVAEPCSTGIGGDVFCIYYEKATGKVHGLNGSGRSPAALTLDLVRSRGIEGNKLPFLDALCVTVPGAPAAWCDLVDAFGTLSMADILKPAIDLAEDGVPVHHVASHGWAKGAHLFTKAGNEFGKDAFLMHDGERAPEEGEIMLLPDLAQTFRELAEKGKAGFYEGRIAEKIVEVVEKNGGVMSLQDLKEHTSTKVDPISVDFMGKRVFEMPPNGQGITALIALNILSEKLDKLRACEHNSVEYLHILIEAMRLAFADATFYVADPDVEHVPVAELLSQEYASERAALIQAGTAMADPEKGKPFSSSDTVYFTVVDDEGNACSFINSNYTGFGSGLVPEGCGFTLQNRGANFAVEEGHPNCVGPKKRPYHTIIPSLITDSVSNDLVASYGVMGGFMQPQGHVQVVLNMLLFGMNPQEALDAPRFCIGPGHEGVSSDVALEEGIAAEVAEALQSMGHAIRADVAGHGRSLFGRGQIIEQRNVQCSNGSMRRVFACGSDPRGDGMAVPQ